MIYSLLVIILLSTLSNTQSPPDLWWKCSSRSSNLWKYRYNDWIRMLSSHDTTTTTTVATTTVNATCVDLLNPLTGVSDCPFNHISVPIRITLLLVSISLMLPQEFLSVLLLAYCNNTIYQPLMRIQCRATCGFCTSGNLLVYSSLIIICNM
ncbi:hypothetical protein PRIPAC_95135 [Pristionchus pacificus]|uniref:ShK domain-containing protein n=1 Tax=Pristionchus pacificus TaxID=54126 RepID=A0A2A6CHC8_PRIPA|nr:hypothetical protein PRIPAC_95135 [Pristionchus pacificus]|eukprot:PDM77478.1 ShK domain-containing protein [Pristionchus pacificus]